MAAPATAEPIAIASPQVAPQTRFGMLFVGWTRPRSELSCRRWPGGLSWVSAHPTGGEAFCMSTSGSSSTVPVFHHNTASCD